MIDSLINWLKKGQPTRPFDATVGLWRRNFKIARISVTSRRHSVTASFDQKKGQPPPAFHLNRVLLVKTVAAASKAYFQPTRKKIPGGGERAQVMGRFVPHPHRAIFHLVDIRWQQNKINPFGVNCPPLPQVAGADKGTGQVDSGKRQRENAALTNQCHLARTTSDWQLQTFLKHRELIWKTAKPS